MKRENNMELAVLFYSYIAVLGLVVGSFLNVCILRIPAGESVVFGASHCPHCEKRLRVFELVPVFSFLALKGRCKGCGAKISVQYPLVEAANALLWVAAVSFLPLHYTLFFDCALLSVLLCVAMVDAKTQEIPFCFNVFIAVIAFLKVGVVFYENGASALISHGIGALCVSLPLFLIYVLSKGRAIGGVTLFSLHRAESTGRPP